MTYKGRNFFQLLIIAILCIQSSCKLDSKLTDICIDPEPSESTITILSIGDSRVEGNTPNFESYRYHLWRNLKLNNWDINFIGSRMDNGVYESVNGICFDNEHEGIGGATTSIILSRLSNMKLEYTPDIVLISIGGNDLLDQNLTVTQILSNLRKIVFQIRRISLQSTIIIEQIAPGKSSFMTPSLTEKITEFNYKIIDLGKTLDRSAARVLTIDLQTNWNDDLMADDLHYNNEGAQYVGDKYFSIISEHYGN